MKNGKKKGSFNKVTKNPLLKRKAKKKKKSKNKQEYTRKEMADHGEKVDPSDHKGTGSNTHLRERERG